jgi:hypothetical protein
LKANRSRCMSTGEIPQPAGLAQGQAQGVNWGNSPVAIWH